MKKLKPSLQRAALLIEKLSKVFFHLWDCKKQNVGWYADGMADHHGGGGGCGEEESKGEGDKDRHLPLAVFSAHEERSGP